MGDRLATTDMGRKVGSCAPLAGELGSHLTQCGWCRGLLASQVSSWSSRLATTYQRHRQDKQTGQTDRQRSDSIRQTVLQTVTQKPI